MAQRPIPVLAAHAPRLLGALALVVGLAAAQPALAFTESFGLSGGIWGQGPSWVLVLLVFAGGLGLNLTPCVYPLIPITISYFGGRSQGSRPALMASSLAYLGGMTLMYSSLGAFVALSGGMLGQALSNPWVTGFLALIMLGLAASMFGLWELRLPTRLNQLGAANRGGVLGAFIMGLTVGILAAPCLGPFVLGLMTHVASVGRLGYGLALFFALSLGLGLPLAVLAFFSGSIHRLPGAGDWMIWVRKLFGVVLVLMAANILRPITGEAAFRHIFAVLGVLGGLYLGLWEKSGKGVFVKIKYAVGALAICAALGFWWWSSSPGQPQGVAHAAWTAYTPAVLNQAAQDKKPVVVDFSASWCAPCRQLEADTLSDPSVKEALTSFRTVRVDVSTDPGPDAKRLMGDWRVRGVPTVVFIDAKGQVMRELTIVGYVGPDEFMDRLKMAQAKGGAS